MPKIRADASPCGENELTDLWVRFSEKRFMVHHIEGGELCVVAHYLRCKPYKMQWKGADRCVQCMRGPGEETKGER